MAVFTRIKTWVSNEILTASDLNAEFNNLLNNTKPQSIEDYSANVSEMQTNTDPGGVGTESLATTLAGEIERLRFVLKRVFGPQWYSDPGRSLAAGLLAVQTADIANDAVTTAKIVNDAITTLKILDSNVTTSKIANANVTYAKLQASSYAETAFGSGSFTSTSTSLVDVTNLSYTFVTTGRPIEISLAPFSTSSSFLRVESSSGNSASANLVILLDGATLAQFPLAVQQPNASGSFTGMSIPPSSIMVPLSGALSAASHAFKVQVQVTSGTTIAVTNCKLVIKELL